MQSTSKFERGYDRFERWWIGLPIVRTNGGLQAFPFILLVCFLFLFANVIGLLAASMFSAGENARVPAYAVVTLLVLMASIFLLAVRGARRRHAAEERVRMESKI